MLSNTTAYRDVENFKKTIEKLAALLAVKGGRVIFRGSECCTDGEMIILPSLDIFSTFNNLEELQRFIKALVGYTVHEVGHRRYTDFNFMKEKKHCKRQIRELWNAIEDPRVERKVQEYWKGTGETLDYTISYVLDENKDKYRKLSTFGQITMLVTFLGRGAAFRRAAQLFDPEIARWVDKNLDEEIGEIPDLKSTRGAYKLARRVYKKICDEVEKQEQKQQEQNQQGGKGNQGDKGESDEQQKGGGKGMQRMREEDEDAGDGNDAGASDDSDRGDRGERSKDKRGKDDGDERESDDGDEDSSASDAGDGDAGGDPSDEAEEGGGDGVSEPQSGDSRGRSDTHREEEDDKGEEQETKLKDDGSVAGRPDTADNDLDLGNTLSESYNGMARQFENANGSVPYAAYTTEGDFHGLIGEPGDSVGRPVGYGHDIRDLEELVRSTVGPLKSALQRMLKAKGRSLLVRNLDSGRLDRRSLYRVPVSTRTSEVPKVYQQLYEAETYNVAVLLMVNESGSMSHRIHLASAAALALGDVLDSLNIKFGVFGHTTGSRSVAVERYKSSKDEDKTRYSRWGNLNIAWVKRFEDLWRARRKSISLLRASQNTYDAEALMHGARMISAVPEVKRRIIMTIDDGEPCPNLQMHGPMHSDELLRVSEEIERSSIEVIGVGIRSESVKRYYKRAVVVQDVDTLPSLLLDVLGTMLGARVKRGA